MSKKTKEQANAALQAARREVWAETTKGLPAYIVALALSCARPKKDWTGISKLGMRVHYAQVLNLPDSRPLTPTERQAFHRYLSEHIASESERQRIVYLRLLRANNLARFNLEKSDGKK